MEILGFGDRGRVAEGYAADLVAFDPLAVRDAATYAEPHAFSEGIAHVYVNGEAVVGEPSRFRSSPPVVRTFCGRCGTSLTYQEEDRADQIDVTTATLDDPEALPPSKAVFEEQKLSWA